MYRMLCILSRITCLHILYCIQYKAFTYTSTYTRFKKNYNSITLVEKLGDANFNWNVVGASGVADSADVVNSTRIALAQSGANATIYKKEEDILYMHFCRRFSLSCILHGLFYMDRASLHPFVYIFLDSTSSILDGGQCSFGIAFIYIFVVCLLQKPSLF